jgi:hypothetical protein
MRSYEQYGQIFSLKQKKKKSLKRFTITGWLNNHLCYQKKMASHRSTTIAQASV